MLTFNSQMKVEDWFRSIYSLDQGGKGPPIHIIALIIIFFFFTSHAITIISSSF